MEAGLAWGSTVHLKLNTVLMVSADDYLLPRKLGGGVPEGSGHLAVLGAAILTMSHCVGGALISVQIQE